MPKTFQELYDSIPSNYDELATDLSEFFGTPISHCDGVFSFHDGKDMHALTLTSEGCQVGVLTIEEYIDLDVSDDSDSSITLPKAEYDHCPISGATWDELPDARLIEVLAAILNKPEVCKATPYGRGGWRFE